MAELGIFASCLQIADAAVTLRKLWSEIRDGPKDVQELAEEVLANAEALANVRQLHQQPDAIVTDSAGRERCYKIFEKAAQSLDELTKELQTLLRNHKRTGSVRLYMRNSDLARCKERFRRTQMIMLTSQQAYSEMFAAQNFSLILRELSAIKLQQKAAETHLLLKSDSEQSSSTGPCARTNVKAYSGQSSPTLNRDTVVYRLELPRWLTRKAFQLFLQKSNSSWGMTLRVYNRVGKNSPLFEFAEAGDWKQVQHLFATGQASPFDVNPWGTDVLAWAARQFDPDACRMLLSHGLSPYSPSGEITAIQHMVYSARSQQLSSEVAGVHETVSLFAGLASDAFFDERGLFAFGLVDTEPSFLELIIKSVCSQYERIDPADRISMAFGSDELDTPRLKVLLGNNLTLRQAFEIALSKKLQYNHLDLLGMTSASFGDGNLYDDQSWFEVLRAIIEFESSNSSTLPYRSALTSFLYRYFLTHSWLPPYHHSGIYNQYVTDIAHRWITNLKEAGANLTHYAAAERVSPKDFLYIPSLDKRGNDVQFQIKFIVGGPEIEDWKVYVVPVSTLNGDSPNGGRLFWTLSGHDEYEMAGDFWDWVENPELFNIPGMYANDEEDYWHSRHSDVEFGPVFVKSPIL